MSSRISQPNPQCQQVIKQSTGKIFKGTMNDAPMKLRVASIPSKFENVVYRNNRIPAFGNSRDRFHSHYEDHKKLEPGPGNYQNADKTQHKIFSKKGYGTLISNTKLDRLQKKYTGLPGPGSYDPKASLLSRTKRSNSLALLSSKLQGHELFKTQLQKSKRIPGPGVYELRLKKSNSQSHPFNNNISRFDHSIQNKQTPGVGHYHYELSSFERQINSQSIKTKYKKSVPQINEISYQQKLKVVRQILNNSTNNFTNSQQHLGPGTYNVMLLDKQLGYKIHQTPYDRFGQRTHKNQAVEKVAQTDFNEQNTAMLIADQVFKTLSQIKNPFSSTKALTSMFKSNIKRYEFVKSNVNDPGRYSPERSDKKSHLINFQKKWV